MKFKKYFSDFTQKVITNLPEEQNSVEIKKFLETLEQKMIKGYHEHGDGVFDRNLTSILGELSFEAIDLVGWGIVAYAIIKRDNLEQEVENEIVSIASDGLINWLRLEKIKQKLAN